MCTKSFQQERHSFCMVPVPNIDITVQLNTALTVNMNMDLILLSFIRNQMDSLVASSSCYWFVSYNIQHVLSLTYSAENSNQLHPLEWSSEGHYRLIDRMPTCAKDDEWLMELLCVDMFKQESTNVALQYLLHFTELNQLYNCNYYSWQNNNSHWSTYWSCRSLSHNKRNLQGRTGFVFCSLNELDIYVRRCKTQRREGKHANAVIHIHV